MVASRTYRIHYHRGHQGIPLRFIEVHPLPARRGADLRISLQHSWHPPTLSLRPHLAQVVARSLMMIDQTKFLEKSIELAEIPGTALKISRVALGTWAIGGWMWGGTDEAESVSTIHAALDHGITY